LKNARLATGYGARLQLAASPQMQSALSPSVARLCVGAHEQKNEPAGGSSSYDGHDTFLNPPGCMVNVAFLHIRSAILKTSQPSAAKPTPQKSMTETTAFSFCFLQESYDVTGGCGK
jgi:hypothetical protein